MNDNQHSIILFKVGGIKKSGVAVGSYLAVSKPHRNYATTYQIFLISPERTSSIGRPYGPEFESKEDAIRMAEFLEKTYQPWLPLMEDYFHLDPIEVCKWSVGYDFTKNVYLNKVGLQLAEAWRKFCEATSAVSLKDFKAAYENCRPAE